MTQATLSAIMRFPVKSCRGEAVASATVEPWGLGGDRRWMLVDDAGIAVTAREVSRLLRVVPRLTATGLQVSAPGLAALEVTTPVPGQQVEVSIWGDRCLASVAGADASAWFSQVTQRPVRLVYLDDPRRRPTDPRRSRPGDVVSFADGYPVLLASQASLTQLNRWIAEDGHADEGPLPMTRFRPNLVVSGAPAWAEDTWRRLRIGDTTFRSAKACDRCVVTMIDPQTTAKTKEPLFTLARHRKWDRKTWFAVNLIAEQAGGALALGDQVEVLDVAATPGPQR